MFNFFIRRRRNREKFYKYARKTFSELQKLATDPSNPDLHFINLACLSALMHRVKEQQDEICLLKAGQCGAQVKMIFPEGWLRPEELVNMDRATLAREGYSFHGKLNNGDDIIDIYVGKN